LQYFGVCLSHDYDYICLLLFGGRLVENKYQLNINRLPFIVGGATRMVAMSDCFWQRTSTIFIIASRTID
jgi:hypothetical protein